MKRTVIGGILTLVGALWGHAIIVVAANNLVSGWPTPPGRLLYTISELGMTIPIAMVSALSLLGLIMMGVEYFARGD